MSRYRGNRKRLTLRLPQDLARRVEALRKQTNLSLTDYLVQCVDCAVIDAEVRAGKEFWL